jgi:hypothetical protein
MLELGVGQVDYPATAGCVRDPVSWVVRVAATLILLAAVY